ncbi:MAG: two-component system sensor histidine kinase CpxA [Phenylobacterium sp.]|jgi:two-component system sensor histidine kinase CpxA
MNWYKRLNPLNFLAGKIFLGFWLMIILTIASMLFITHQVEPNIEDQPIPRHIFAQIQSLEDHMTRISRRKGFEIKRLLHSPRFGRREQGYIFIDEQQKIFNSKPLPPEFERANLPVGASEPETVLEAGILVYGPFEIAINQTHLRLFLFKPYRPHPMEKFRNLPPWVRFGLPLLISALLSFAMAMSLVKPIHQLRNAHRSLAQGNLDARSNGVALRNDELGQLGQDFDDMADKISQLLAAQKRLLGDVSHELRSPLARMQVALGLALQPESKDLPRHLQRIELEANRLDDMIGDVLRLSRLESQLQNIEMFKQPLKSLLEYLIKDAHFEAQQSNKSVKLITSDDANVQGDQALLASAFENVLRNAVKYTDQDTCVEVSLSLSECLSEQLSDNQVIVTIRDFGPGVPASALSQLFQPFYRVSDSRQRRSGGTGLGLAIAEKSVRSHGGSIIAHNHQDKGLEITIKLPRTN